MLDLTPATDQLTWLVIAVPDTQLGAPTPCQQSTLGDLLDHVDGLSLGFAAAARKSLAEGEAAPSADGSRLGTDWRARIATRLAELARAWQAEDAWSGMTRIGAVDLPGDVTGLVAINELVVHGWDIAVASGQSFECSPELIEGALGFVQVSVSQNPHGTPGLFGPPVDIAGQADPLARLLALTGRDPNWQLPQ